VGISAGGPRLLQAAMLVAAAFTLTLITPFQTHCQPLLDEGQARMRSLTAQIEREYQTDLRNCTDTQCAQHAKARAAQRLKQVELVEARMQRQVRECKLALRNDPQDPALAARAAAVYETARNQCAGNPDCLVQARLRAASALSQRHQEATSPLYRTTAPPTHSWTIALSRFRPH
jgi:hypothetical protein